MWNIGLALLLLCGTFEYGVSIMCYECNSVSNPLCLEKDMPDALKRNCSEYGPGVQHTLCRKVIQTIEFGTNNQLPMRRVIRTCGWDESKYKDSCYHRSGFGGHQDVCSCNTDFCNDSQKVNPGGVLILTIVLFIRTVILKCQ